MARPATITFKAEAELADALARLPNKSEFIRQAVLAALGATCPLCGGTGFLSEAQQAHWDRFSRHHGVVECEDCHEPHLVCAHCEEAAC
jgi:hypothetical protein